MHHVFDVMLHFACHSFCEEVEDIVMICYMNSR